MPLGEAAVVQCSKTAHTLLQHLGKIMDRLPTLVIVAEPPPWAANQTALPPIQTPHGKAIKMYDTIHCALLKGLESGLPLIFVAPLTVAIHAKTTLPGSCIVEIDPEKHMGDQRDYLARAIATGVLASADSNGWLILPTSAMPHQTETLQRIAKALYGQSIVFPEYKSQQGLPIAFSTEFFSELIHLQSEKDLNRLIARYPSTTLSVNDPGVLFSEKKFETINLIADDARSSTHSRH